MCACIIIIKRAKMSDPTMFYFGNAFKLFLP